MDKTVGTLRQLFQWLYQEQQVSWFPERRKRTPSARAQEVWYHLVNRWTPIRQEDLDRWFPSSASELDVDFSHPRSLFLYLPPLEKDAEFVPILSLKCRLDTEKTVMKLRVMLVCLVEDDQENEDKEKLRGIGFRLESPHGDEYEGERNEGEEKREGRHDFYHAQIVRGFGWGPLVESPSWLPETQPSFPLVADCPVTLVLCLLLTLYGKRQSLELIKRNTGLWSWLRPYVGRLQTWIKWKELEGALA